MKIAVLSDIHGNHVALEAFLKDLEGQGSVDHAIVAGDMFTFGPAPNEVLAGLKEFPRDRCLVGNTDCYLLEGTYPSTHGKGDWQDKLLYSFQWTAERLAAEGLRFLEGLPAFQFVAERRQQFLVVHGSPRSDEEGITLETEAGELEDMPIGPQVAVLACGHTHIPMDREVRGVRVVNVG